MLRTRSRTRGGGSAWYKSTAYLLNNVAPTLIHDYAKDRYYDSVTGPQSFPFTATRTTNATMFDSSGNLVWAPANMIAFSQPVLNGTWTLSGAGTTSTGGQPDPFGGTTGANLIAGNGISTILNDSNASIRFAANLTVISGAIYTFVFYAKANVVDAVRVREPVASGARAKIDLITGAITTEAGVTNNMTTGVLVEAAAQSNGWWKISVTRKTTSTGFNIDIKPGQDIGDGVSGVFISSVMVHPYDGFQKAFIQTTGTAKFGHRIDCDPNTLTPYGLLVEGSSTNLSPIYGEFGQLGYVSGGIVGNPTQGITGFGKQFHLITGDGIAGTHNCSGGAMAVAPTASTIHTSSAYAKAGTQSLVQLTVSGNFAAADVYANFDLSNGTIGTVGAGVTNPSIVNCGNGIYRLSISYTTSAAPTAGAATIVGMITSLTDARLPSNTLATTLNIFGYQMEVGNIATSLIPTFGVSATRAADIIESSTGAWFTQSLGTVFIKYVAPQNVSGLFPALVTIDDNTASNRLNTFFQSNATNVNFGARIDDAAVIQVNTTTLGTVLYRNTASAAIAYAANNTRFCQASAAITSDLVCTIPIALNTLRIGKSAAATSGTRWIKEFRYYPSVSASDAQLQALTA